MKYLIFFLVLASVQGRWIAPKEVGSGDGGFTVYYDQADCDKTSDAPCLEVPEGYNPYYHVIKDGKIIVDDDRKKSLEDGAAEMEKLKVENVKKRQNCKKLALTGDLTGDTLQECLALML